MLRITIELLPHGDETRKRLMGILDIDNDATGNEEIGNYTYRISKWDNPKTTWKTGVLRDFPRKRLGPWDLLYRLLADAVGKRNPS